MVEEGKSAPQFELPGTDGAPVKLAALQGRSVVLYFYPKDDTSGCTTEARDFTALKGEFAAAGAVVIGISPDSVASHQKFMKKYDLNLQLVADVEKTASTAFGVWVEKSMYGKKYMGVERSTFLIDKAGKVAKLWRKVKVPGHAAEVLAAAKAIKR